jgi:hypothetical protein
LTTVTAVVMAVAVETVVAEMVVTEVMAAAMMLEVMPLVAKVMLVPMLAAMLAAKAIPVASKLTALRATPDLILKQISALTHLPLATPTTAWSQRQKHLQSRQRQSQ